MPRKWYWRSILLHHTPLSFLQKNLWSEQPLPDYRHLLIQRSSVYDVYPADVSPLPTWTYIPQNNENPCKRSVPHVPSTTGSSDFLRPEQTPDHLTADHSPLRDTALQAHSAYKYRYFRHPSTLSLHESFYPESPADPAFLKSLNWILWSSLPDDFLLW